MTTVDARGLSCPEPVILTKRAMQKEEASYDIIVDNVASRENVTRFAEHQGYRVTVEERGGEYTLKLRK